MRKYASLKHLGRDGIYQLIDGNVNGYLFGPVGDNDPLMTNNLIFVAYDAEKQIKFFTKDEIAIYKLEGKL